MKFAAQSIRATVLHARMRQYSTIVNILSLQEIHEFLNDCYAPITEAVLEHAGTIDRFTDDRIVAVFTSSQGHEDHAVKALNSALHIQARLTDINITWRTSLDFLVMFDIGIATGEVLSGNVGHPEKVQHTVIGRQVHLAAELAKLCKSHNVEILADVATFEKAREAFQFQELGERLILGFPEPIKLFSPVQES